jgi:signal transduction histidine kinase
MICEVDLRKLFNSQRNTITIDFIIFLFCIVGIYNVTQKSDLPFIVDSQNSGLLITSIENHQFQFKEGDKLISIDNIKLESREEIEMYLDGRNPGELIKVVLSRDDQLLSETVELTSFYSSLYLVIASLVGVLFFIVAIIVLVKCERINLRNSFHWAFVFTGMIILMTWGNYSILPFNLGIITRFGFHIGYLFAPVFFLKFAFIFPSSLDFKQSRIIQVLHLVAILLVFALSLSFYFFVNSNDLEKTRVYISIFDISSLFIVLVTLSAISVFVNTYITTSNETDRKKIRWIMIGFILGPLSYLLLWVVPFRIWNQSIIPEEVVLLLIAFVPITFGISIVKYRLMNVDIILRRGIVYTTLITVLLLVYMITLSLLTTFLNVTNSQTTSIIAAISIALLFQPAKMWVQKFVDRKFFKIMYDFRLALKLLNREIKDIHNSKKLCEVVVDFIDNLIHVNKIGCFTLNPKSGKIELSMHKNFDKLNDNQLQVNLINKLQFNSNPLACSNNIDPEAQITKASLKEFEFDDIDLIFNIKSSRYESHGFLILGEKKSQTKFTAEDIDLLNTVVSRLSLTLDRIKLQEEIIKEQLETERLEELNRLKTYFVSSVSHDLKTPLTSIKLFAERLKSSQDLPLEKKHNYLEIIEGESDRLTRLINNVLDFSKIERGVQQYKFSPANLVEIVKKVLVIMEYQFRMNNFDVNAKYEANNIMANIDADAVSEAIINILSNSLKYYSDKKQINILVKSDDAYATIDIEDKGKGIDPEDLANIFEPFFRSKDLKVDKAGGAGLGLAIVKHIMDAHKGEISVKSIKGKGSTFSLLFPLGKSDDKDITN